MPVPVSRVPWFSAFFRHGHLLALSIVILLVAGISALSTLPRLEDPRIDTRNVLVITPYPGASAQRVEALISDVLEDELRQLSEIKEIKSTSRADISVINIELQAWVDNTTNEQIFSKIRDSLSDARQRFPAGAGDPELDEKRGATSFTLLLGLGAPEGGQVSMPLVSRLADELADRLRNVPGTELVRIYGDVDEEVRVTLDPQQLAATGLTLEDVSQRIQAADPKLPAGTLRSAQNTVRLQVAEALDGLDIVRSIPVSSNAVGGTLQLGDIADVEKAWQVPERDIGLLNGQRIVYVAARMQPSVRVDTWTEAAMQAVNGFEREFAASVKTDVVFEQNHYTQARLGELTQNLLLGCLVVMMVVMLFMGVRSAWIVGLSLPLSAAFALFSLSFYDEQIHQMSIFGIIIAIGLLIDNAIVITDEIRSNLLDASNSRLDALVISIRHLFGPLLASTLTTVLGFMPIFLLPGNIGDFISSIAISVVMALLGSLFISMTIIAALAARYLPRGDVHASLPWYRRGIDIPVLSQSYRRFLERALTRPLWVLLFTIALPLAGFGLSTQLGNVFFPSADRDQFEMYVWMPAGTPLARTEQMVETIDQQLRHTPGIDQVNWLVGGSVPSVYYNQVMLKDNTPHYAQAVIHTDTVSDAARLVGALQQQFDDALPEAKVIVRAFGQGPPIASPIGVEVYGNDLETLDVLGQQVRRLMSDIPGVTQTTASITLGEPELVLNADRHTSQLAQLPLNTIAAQLQTGLNGKSGGSILEGTEEIPVRVRLPDAYRSTLSHLASTPLVNVSGQWVPLQALGDFTYRASLAGITRKNGERVNIIEGFLLPGAKAVDVSREIQRRLDSEGFHLPDGYHIRLAGDADEQQEALGLLATYAPVLLVLMITTLILTFSSVRFALVIGSVAVLSVGLGMFSLWLSGLPIGFNPLLGCAGLIGVAINGSIVVIAAIRANPDAHRGDTQAIIAETMGCSRHILSTTVTTVGGFIPLLLFSEGTFWPPLAVVLAGGVGFSVLLSLVYTPLVSAILARREGRRWVKMAEQPA
ncbi:efflux RND transporter permease subunit [Aestuariibacter halophilus]|uniref:Efflux RND transporter permease subunit n=1 Tax=Fluctibacter halophilus TaxID=226011 RepID=A0ABS8GDW9_9ALTE|nr:efflux RND transporter permease subunit [Aestuariibacter halophilus]MCC2617401.1 efflux RND transporter permease subunit [Aestuariibacter halophilus]